MATSTFPKLVDDLRMTVFDSAAYIETPRQLQRVDGEHLSQIQNVLLPLLDGRSSVGSIVQQLDGCMERSSVLSILEELNRSHLLRPTDAAAQSISRITVNLLGDESLGELIRPLLSSEQIIAVVGGDDSDVNVLATRSLMDPSTAKAQKRLLETPQPHIVFGVDFDGHGFIGPYRAHDSLNACAVCIRTRLTANAGDSETRSTYIGLLDQAQATPLHHSVPHSLAISLASWLVHRINASQDQTAAQNAILTRVDRDTLATRHHPALPVPTCSVCEAHQSDVPHTRVLNLEDAVDDKVGIVHAVNVRTSRSGPSIHLSGTTSADSRLIRPSMRAANNGGAGFTKLEALNAGIGESVERYCAGVYRSDDLRLASWASLDVEAVHPKQFAKLSESQLAGHASGFKPFTEDTPVRWARSTRWRDGTTVLIPASQVFLPYRRVRGEAAIGQSISTGQAAGPSTVAAVLGGLREVVERDALAISWMHRLPPRKLDPRALDESPTLRRHLSQRTDWDVRFYDLSLDDLTSSVVAVMEQGNGNDRVLTFGSACRSQTPLALEKAFLEAAQGIPFVRRLLTTFETWDPGEEFENVQGFNEHAILYSKFPQLRFEVNYLLARDAPPPQYRPPRIPTDADRLDDSAELDRLVEQLGHKGYETYVVDLTTPDAAMLGVRVMKVLVPGYVHVAGSHADRLLGSARLTSVPAELGVSSQPDNPYPHPLP